MNMNNSRFRIESEFFRRKPRFKIKVHGHLDFVQPKLAGLSKKHCEVYEIGSDGACFTVMDEREFPGHFYITVPGIVERAGCAEIWRNRTRVGVRFISALDEAKLTKSLKNYKPAR